MRQPKKKPKCRGNEGNYGSNEKQRKQIYNSEIITLLNRQIDKQNGDEWVHRQTDIHMDRPLNQQAVRYRQIQNDKPLQQFAGKLRLRLRPRLFIRRVSRQCQDRFATDDGFSGRDDCTYPVQHHNTVINNNQPGRQPANLERG